MVTASLAASARAAVVVACTGPRALSFAPLPVLVVRSPLRVHRDEGDEQEHEEAVLTEPLHDALLRVKRSRATCTDGGAQCGEL